MRNISFSLTIDQFKDGSKDATRRLGWVFLKPGDRLMGCEKCQGVKKGEIQRLGVIEVVSVRREPLSAMTSGLVYGRKECRREGFPNMSPRNFVTMFCLHMDCTEDTVVTRIEFKHAKPFVWLIDGEDLIVAYEEKQMKTIYRDYYGESIRGRKRRLIPANEEIELTNGAEETWTEKASEFAVSPGYFPAYK